MKLPRILLSALAIGALASVTLQAQENKGKRPQQSPQEMVATIDKEVGGLKDDQKAKILDIIAKGREKMQGLSAEERREKGREIMQAQNQEIRAVLTAEQQPKYDEALAQRRSKGGKKKSE